MKKILILSLLALLGFSLGISQDYEYVPFVREGVKWECCFHYDDYENPDNSIVSNYTLEISGDAVINGKTYKVMHKYSGEGIDWENDTVPVYLREEDKVVYGIVPDGKAYFECPVGFLGDDASSALVSSGEEFVLYDFNDFESFIQTIYNPTPYLSTVIPHMVKVGGQEAMRYIFRRGRSDKCCTEGIGYDSRNGDGAGGYPLGMTVGNEQNAYAIVQRVLAGGEEIYVSESLLSKPWSVEDKELPIPREGVQWVNERVIIDHDVETKEYYTYEFSGTDFHGNAMCYSYTGDALDITNATLVAQYQCMDYQATGSDGNIYNNVPFDKVKSEGRNMVYFGLQMYSFDNYATDISASYTPNFYIYSQKDEFLTRENLIEVEPLMIEDTECSRFAYVGEDGEVQAYIVEGIGFDSRDMGDLLTPFTRRPDPDAEYQEYWGLSHVVKDGKIIYKGMRYNPALFEKRGDVNGDGNVTIADVSALIDMLIDVKIGAGGSSYSCDVNGDSNVSIADVSALIDMLLVQP